MNESIVVYKITFKKHINLLLHLILMYASLFIFFYIILGWTTITSAVIWVFFIVLTIDILPTIFVHSQYIAYNGRQKIYLDFNQQIITVESTKTEKSWSFDDITALHCYSSYGAETYYYSFSYHRFCKLTFNDGQEIIITNLLMAGVQKRLPSLLNIVPENHYRLIAFIY